MRHILLSLEGVYDRADFDEVPYVSLAFFSSPTCTAFWIPWPAEVAGDSGAGTASPPPSWPA
eukprot:7572036-Lingulodinium_polyedra.AAC.1